MLADALDRDDFATVMTLLDDECEYETGREPLHGPEAIVGSYAKASHWANEKLDAVRYESEVEPGDGRTVGVRFIDHLRKGDREHTYSCRQEFTVNAAGKVSRIVHHNIPGEPESLRKFFVVSGISKG